jgi:hypothetical protein
MQRGTDEADKEFNILLDLPEEFGAACAAGRLVEREAERKE